MEDADWRARLDNAARQQAGSNAPKSHSEITDALRFAQNPRKEIKLGPFTLEGELNPEWKKFGNDIIRGKSQNRVEPKLYFWFGNKKPNKFIPDIPEADGNGRLRDSGKTEFEKEAMKNEAEMKRKPFIE